MTDPVTVDSPEAKQPAPALSPVLIPAPHPVLWLAAGLRRAAAGLGVELPMDYARALAATADGEPLGVSRLGAGVVIHTVPEEAERLSVLVGVADAEGQWYRDGVRHQEPERNAGSTGSVQ